MILCYLYIILLKNLSVVKSISNTLEQANKKIETISDVMAKEKGIFFFNLDIKYSKSKFTSNNKIDFNCFGSFFWLIFSKQLKKEKILMKSRVPELIFFALF